MFISSKLTGFGIREIWDITCAPFLTGCVNLSKLLTLGDSVSSSINGDNNSINLGGLFWRLNNTYKALSTCLAYKRHSIKCLLLLITINIFLITMEFKMYYLLNFFSWNILSYTSFVNSCEWTVNTLLNQFKPFHFSADWVPWTHLFPVDFGWCLTHPAKSRLRVCQQHCVRGINL